MSRQREALLARRTALVARAAAQRDDLAHQLGAWEGAFARVDRAMAWLRGLRSSPLLGIGVGVVLVAVWASRGRIPTWFRSGAAAWRHGRSALGWISALRA